MLHARVSATPYPSRLVARSVLASLRRIAVALVLFCGAARGQVQLLPGPSIPPLPDPIGRAGMAASVVVGKGSASALLAVGGANFPRGMPWAGGEKAFYRDVFALERASDESCLWRRVGELPEAKAYAAFGASVDGLVVAGGVNATGHLRSVHVVAPSGAVRELSALPTPLAYAASVVDGRKLYVIGGQTSPMATRAEPQLLVLDLAQPDAGWRQRLWPEADRILANAGILDGKIWLIGGCSLHADDKGAPVRTYLRDAVALRLSEIDQQGAIETCATIALPHPLAASAAPAMPREGVLVFAGGDDGSHYGKPPQDHPGQRAEWYALDPRSRSVQPLGLLAQGAVTAPLVAWDDAAIVVSGEIKPGVRTASVQSARVRFAASPQAMDWCMGVASLLALAACWRSSRRSRAPSGPLQPLAANDSPSRSAWVAVGLLFVVAMLNYLDRQLLATTAAPILRDITQTNAQFGLLTAVFLFVYAALGPLGGVLADRMGRRRVILVSLVVWSAVTWLTGKAQTYPQLVVARALMGVSEACYIPAALALITDHHRGRTRSLATGLHMSGVYAGQALAGIGGFAAEAFGWRTAYSLFGMVGVVYAIVLAAFLRDPAEAATAGPANASVPMRVPSAQAPSLVRGLLGRPSFWLLLVVMGGASISNWFLLSWLPRLLQQRFDLSLGAAGTLATLPLSLAKYAAVVVGAIVADRWAQRDPRGRSKLAAITFVVAGPVIAATSLLPEGAIVWFVGMVACQGIAQGVLDATLMPILRSRIDERLAATGYGCLNLVGAGIGGLTVLYGGALQDAGIPLSVPLAASGAGLLLCGVALALLPATVSRDE
jgi:MFS family permease